MARAAIRTISEFPDIRDDFVQIADGVGDAEKDLTSKLRQVYC